MIRRLLKRLGINPCRLGAHRWAGPLPPTRYGDIRECMCCPVRERFVSDAGGVSAGVWEPFSE